MYPSDDYSLSAAVGSRKLVDLDVWYGETERPRFHGLWVCAAIPIVFGFAPPVEPGSCDRLLECPFFAVVEHDDQFELHGFVCSDPELEPELEFFRDTDPDLAARIATAFWGLLLANRRQSRPFERSCSWSTIRTASAGWKPVTGMADFICTMRWIRLLVRQCKSSERMVDRDCDGVSGPRTKSYLK